MLCFIQLQEYASTEYCCYYYCSSQKSGFPDWRLWICKREILGLSALKGRESQSQEAWKAASYVQFWAEGPLHCYVVLDWTVYVVLTIFTLTFFWMLLNVIPILGYSPTFTTIAVIRWPTREFLVRILRILRTLWYQVLRYLLQCVGPLLYEIFGPLPLLLASLCHTAVFWSVRTIFERILDWCTICVCERFSVVFLW